MASCSFDLAALYQRHYTSLCRVAKQVLGDTKDCEDVVQQAFVYALGQDFRGDCAPYTFLYQLTQNEALNVYRKRRLRTAFLRRLDRRLPTRACEERRHKQCLQEAQEGPSLALQELREAVQAAMNLLPPKRRRVASLCWLEGRSLDEVSQELGISKACVGVHLFNARKVLQPLLIDFNPYTSCTS